jgi:hypothetical protein
MNRDKLLKEHAQWHEVIKDAVAPLLAEDTEKGPGLLAIRTFYVMRNKDGDVTAGQVGITPEGCMEHGADLIRGILAMLMDAEKNRTQGWREAPPKQ